MDVKFLLGVKSNFEELMVDWRGTSKNGDLGFVLALGKAYISYANKITRLNHENVLSQKFIGTAFSVTNRRIDFSSLSARNSNRYSDAKIASEAYYTALLEYLKGLNTLESQRMMFVIREASANAAMVTMESKFANTGTGVYLQSTNSVLVPTTAVVKLSSDEERAALAIIEDKTTTIDSKYEAIIGLMGWVDVSKMSTTKITNDAYKKFIVKSIIINKSSIMITTFKRVNIHSLFASLDGIIDTLSVGPSEIVSKLDINSDDITNDEYLQTSKYGSPMSDIIPFQLYDGGLKIGLMSDIQINPNAESTLTDLGNAFRMSIVSRKLFRQSNAFIAQPLMSIALVNTVAKSIEARVGDRDSLTGTINDAADAFLYAMSYSKADYLTRKRRFLVDSDQKFDDAMYLTFTTGLKVAFSVKSQSVKPLTESLLFSMSMLKDKSSNIFNRLTVPAEHACGTYTAFEFDGSTLFKYNHHPDCCGLSLGYGFDNRGVTDALVAVNEYILNYSKEHKTTLEYAQSRFRSQFWLQAEHYTKFRPVIQFTLAKYQEAAVDLIKLLGGVPGVSYINDNSGNTINTLYMPTRTVYMREISGGGSRGSVLNATHRGYKNIGSMAMKVADWFVNTKKTPKKRVSEAESKAISK